MAKKTKSLDKLNEWIERRGYTLRSGKVDCIIYSDKVIQINFTKNNKHAIYSLLHECGHLIGFNRASYNREFSNLSASESDKRVRRTNRFKYELLKDEMFAWEAGLKLATRLKIEIDSKDYYNYASKWYMTYVKFCGNKP